MEFLRPKAGKIYKASRTSVKEGFKAFYEEFLLSDTADKWQIFHKALNETEFYSVCTLLSFMENLSENFTIFCDIFGVISPKIVNNELKFSELLNTVKSSNCITPKQIKDIEFAEENDGVESAALLLFAFFKPNLSSLKFDLLHWFSSLEQQDLLSEISKLLPGGFSIQEDSTNRQQMIEILYNEIQEEVNPLDIWLPIARDLSLPKTEHIPEWREGTRKIITLFQKSEYPGKFQSLFAALESAGYERLCKKIDNKFVDEERHQHYKKLIELKAELLQNKILPLEICDSLFRENVINKSDRDKIQCLQSREGDIIAAQHLLKIIPLKKIEWFNSFFTILDKNKKRNLVSEIDKEWKFDDCTHKSIDESVDTDDTDERDELDESYELDESDENKEIEIFEYKLEEFQKELIKPALSGKNSIITAPTGSGKTIMAMEIIKDHFDKQNDEKHKVVFLCNQVQLANQQAERLEKCFPLRKVNIISGDSEAQLNKSDLFTQGDIVVMTPQCLVEDLKTKRISGLSVISLLIIDECHHTYAKHPYNMVMEHYIEDKFEREDSKLPQVVGLTAVAGLEVLKTGKSSKEHIMEICANLDCEKICVTKNNVRNLNEFINKPDEYIVDQDLESKNTFTKLIEEFMDSIHESLDKKLFINLPNYGTCRYTGSLSLARNTVYQSNEERKHEIAAFRCLEICNIALQFMKACNVKCAMEYIEDELDSETLDTDQFKTLKELLNRKLLAFQKTSTFLEQEAESSCLKKLIEIICESFKEDPQTQMMVFAETKAIIKALKNVLADKEETKHLKPQYIMSATTIKDDGVRMSLNQQKTSLESFRQGQCRLLISTPVGEEGLDIQKCNLVIDYMTVLGVRSHVQKKGRARKKGSKYIIITGADEDLKKRAKNNKSKADKLEDIVKEVDQYQSEHPLEFIESLKKIQRIHFEEAKYRAKVEERLRHNCQVFKLKCVSCNFDAIESTDFRYFEDKVFVVINPNFKDKIIEYNSAPKEIYNNIKNVGKFLCSNCKCFWGNKVMYEKAVFYCIKINRFKIIDTRHENETPTVAKKWMKVPFNKAIPQISEEEFENYRISDSYLENCSITEGSSDELSSE
ncbi:probable ATP-dependent RNA helicase DHX58 [Argonauta hians]